MSNRIQTWTYEEFHAVKEQFDLGELITEQRHPDSKDLSQLSVSDPLQAIKVLKDIDIKAIRYLNPDVEVLQSIRAQVKAAWTRGGRVFISGCGSTGRMAFVLEKIANGRADGPVVALMAAGDIALVHSVAGFEDSYEYAHRQMEQAEFSSDDFLIACTEGGETPFVIGTVQFALKLTSRSCAFLYCNPTEVLVRKVERSREVIENPKVLSIDATVGPMALSGSTRLQATTAQTLVLGWILFSQEGQTFEQLREVVLQDIASWDESTLAEIVKQEAQALSEGDMVVYQSKSLPMAVFTDIAERGPTFSLKPLQQIHDEMTSVPTLTVAVPGTRSSSEAWLAIFGRSPSALKWASTSADQQLREEYIGQFDWSEKALGILVGLMGKKPTTINVELTNEEVTAKIEISCLAGEQIPIKSHALLTDFDQGAYSHLRANLLVKMILNTHSTVVMGRIGRFHKNMMTYVRPTNGKLIDRARRYVKWLLQDEGKNVDDDKILKTIFARIERDAEANESVVLNTFKELT